MNNATRKRNSAQNMADQLNRDVGLAGWIIVDSSTWYGPYASKDQARERIGTRDSLDMKISGIVIKAGN